MNQTTMEELLKEVAVTVARGVLYILFPVLSILN